MKPIFRLCLFIQFCTCSFFFLDDITGFEITYIMELPEPYSFIFTWFAAVPVIVYLALSITKLIIKDFLILKVRTITITQDCKRKTSKSLFMNVSCFTGSLSELWNGKHLLLWNNSVNLQRRQNQHCQMHQVRFYLRIWFQKCNILLSDSLIISVFSCGTAMVYDSGSRLITLPEGSQA